MPLVEWFKSFDLGIEEFDEHHRHLVGLLNIVFDVFMGGAGHEALRAVLDELINYATYHFTAEEHWMGVHDYPQLTQHCEEHGQFSSKVREIQEDFRNGKTKLSLEVMHFLKNWLTNHILRTDAEYGLFATGLPRATHWGQSPGRAESPVRYFQLHDELQAPIEDYMGQCR